MLSIFNKDKSNLFVYREAPEFAKSLNADLENGASYILDVNMLCDSILIEMDCKSPHPGRIYDYAFICFMLGNDFLPHFPALNIRTNGIYNLLTAYKETVGCLKDTLIIANGEIDWVQFKKMIAWMAEREEGWIKMEYVKRKEMRVSMSGGKEERINNAPMIYREVEEYINPMEEKWEERYKEALLLGEEMSDNYVEGLEWVYGYYREECYDWGWKYKNDYPPLLKELSSLVKVKKERVVKEAVDVKVQMAYVLPVEYLNLDEREREKSYYKFEGKFKWAFCRYFWEGHLVMDYMPI
jgi:5'-3' exonuclease